MAKITFHIITIFPEAFDSYFGQSILKRAIEKKLIAVKFYNPRDFTSDKHKKVDDRPYGGGPGMVMYAEPIIKAVDKIKSEVRPPLSKVKVILFAAEGKQFDNATAGKLSKKFTDIIMIAGHYEGIDARVTTILRAQEISIGSYILTGGELPAMILVDFIARQIEGVLGKYESLEEKRQTGSKVYTRPEVVKYKDRCYKVPKVLLSGNHKKIEEYRARKRR